jgi:dihydrofolate reductase
MRQLTVFNNISLDGYFTDARSDMSWAHKSDPEWTKFSASNAQGSDGALLFGRKTYDMMAAYWPTPEAKKQMPEIAEGINRLPKFVVSRSLDRAAWNNTTILKGDLETEVARLKNGSGSPIVIMGSGTLVAQLARLQLIDEYTLAIVPVVLGRGRTLFEGLDRKLGLKRTRQRAFENGNVVATYVPE